jgi:hypothetical protein
LRSSAALGCTWSLAIKFRKALISDSETTAPSVSEDDAATYAFLARV